jgi:hypothetical protein
MALTVALSASLAVAIGTAADEPAPADSVRSPYGPVVTDERGKVEVWRLPALAKEDTFGVRLRYELREIEIEAERLSIKEILRLAQEGERRRRESIRDLSYTEDLRAWALGGRWGNDDKTRIFEQRSRVYIKPPDRELHVKLAEREYGDQDREEDATPEARVSVGMNDLLDLAEAPWYLQDIDSYRYKIHDRQIFPDRALYAIAFEPHSAFDMEPTGIFWIDAGEFVVVHEEVWFERNPAPLFLKSIDNIVRERHKLDGHWMVTRFQAAVELRGAVLFGFKKAEFEMVLSDFAFNTGLPDSLFTSEQ